MRGGDTHTHTPLYHSLLHIPHMLFLSHLSLNAGEVSDPQDTSTACVFCNASINILVVILLLHVVTSDAATRTLPPSQLGQLQLRQSLHRNEEEELVDNQLACSGEGGGAVEGHAKQTSPTGMHLHTTVPSQQSPPIHTCTPSCTSPPLLASPAPKKMHHIHW